jgi:predicted RNA binding protein YcfA (HicA-like mRNA interferase family)
VLNAKGFILVRSKGSHMVFSNGNDKRISLPKHGATINIAYVKQILSLIGE